LGVVRHSSDAFFLSKVIYNVAVVHVQLKSQKLEYIRPSSNKNLSKYFQVIVTLNYFALFKEVLPCMFVISVPCGKHFNLRVGFIIGESGRENETLKYIG